MDVLPLLISRPRMPGKDTYIERAALLLMPYIDSIPYNVATMPPRFYSCPQLFDASESKAQEPAKRTFPIRVQETLDMSPFRVYVPHVSTGRTKLEHLSGAQTFRDTGQSLFVIHVILLLIMPGLLTDASPVQRPMESPCRVLELVAGNI
jgi:hypothetical protein